MTEDKAQRNAAMLSQKMMEMTKLQKMLTHATKVMPLFFLLLPHATLSCATCVRCPYVDSRKSVKGTFAWISDSVVTKKMFNH